MQIGATHIIGTAIGGLAVGGGLAAMSASRHDETAAMTVAGIGAAASVASIGAWHLFGGGVASGTLGVGLMAAGVGAGLVTELGLGR